MLNLANFGDFYRDHFLAEHRSTANIALHMAGTVGGLALLLTAFTGLISPWWAFAFPIVHVAPGLIGHRLFERNEAVGDVRVLRTDFPGYWFIIANHVLLFRLLTGRR
ncbi:MAG: hypothetical protein RL481_492 [Pseudomonadota bacterium]